MSGRVAQIRTHLAELEHRRLVKLSYVEKVVLLESKCQLFVVPSVGRYYLICEGIIKLGSYGACICLHNYAALTLEILFSVRFHVSLK